MNHQHILISNFFVSLQNPQSLSGSLTQLLGEDKIKSLMSKRVALWKHLFQTNSGYDLWKERRRITTLTVWAISPTSSSARESSCHTESNSSVWWHADFIQCQLQTQIVIPSFSLLWAHQFRTPAADQIGISLKHLSTPLYAWKYTQNLPYPLEWHFAAVALQGRNSASGFCLMTTYCVAG